MSKNRKSAGIMRFHGRATFDNGTLDDLLEYEVKEAIFKDNVLTFDWHLPDGAIETFHLTTLNGTEYRGRATLNPGTKWEEVASVEAVLYQNDRGRVLIGNLDAEGEDEALVVQFFNGEKVRSRT
jgi:hypothetical protein